MSFILRVVFCSLWILSVAHAKSLPLMPMPANITELEGKFQLDQKNLTVYLAEKYRDPSEGLFEHAAFIQQFAKVNWVEKNKAQLVIDVDNWLPAVPTLGVDESYQLSISSQGILLKSATQFGMLRGFSTLSQLVFSTKQPYLLSAIKIDDTPAYPWRGLLFDSVRHFLPIADVKRTLRGLALAKMNVFHWHLTDDQGWRIALKSYPKLHQHASDGLYYTQQQIKDVVSYAAQLGIRVVPEFDVPGHASSIVLAYPELGSGTTPTSIERHWGVFRPLLDPSNPKVYTFVEDVVKELTELFPDAYLHIGGDEVDARDWQENKKIQAFMAEHDLPDSHALHAYFNQRVAKILAKYNRKMIGWDEVLHPTLPKQTLVQSWRGHHSLAAIQKAGFDGLLSSGFYIDQPQWTNYHYRNHPEPIKRDPLTASNILSSAQFTLTRLKGSAVTGDISVFTTADSELAALVTITGKGAFITRNVKQRAAGFEVLIDTWMGPTMLVVATNKVSNLPAFVGNTPYDLQTKPDEKPSIQVLNQTLHDTQQVKKSGEVLGGEATIWAELVTTDTIDTRLWPRVYAIAERFWSPKSMTDERDMYRRLAIMDEFAIQHGSKHKAQFISRLENVLADNANQANINTLLTFSTFIEPAHYYTLHHLAYLRNEYHHDAPLDKLVDVLPVESLQLRAFNYQVEDFRQQCATELKETLQSQVSRWKEFITDQQKVIESIPEWQQVYKQIEASFNTSDVQPIANNNGTIAHVIASLNHYKEASNHCESMKKSHF